ncbi:unnamed protein product [Paramecium sonneborni]|uniref:Mitochondrial import inner membrane translocase subunit TIM50 n=1 Tax=Paramecium sonneborni TaxID=65129 RepID=A0A8S1KFE0_9CILI|nr:unnamed protein product [Paramecium sonneborni]
MNQLKAIQSSVDTQRKRNSSFKQEKSYYEQAKRRKSVYMDQMEDYSQNYILKNYKSFLPQIKRDHLNSDGQDIQMILNHFKLYQQQNSKPINWNLFFVQIWEFIQKNGDIYDLYQELFKKQFFIQFQQLQKQITDICYYEKILISLGFELHQDQLFSQFFCQFVQNYQSCLQELFQKGKFSKKQTQDAQQLIQMNNTIDYIDIDDMYEKFQPGNNTIWMIQRKCKQTQQYKLNFKIVRRHLALWLHETRNLEIIKLLPKQLLTASHPFINAKLTQPILIIDLDETLVHFDQTSNKLMIRNGSIQFLQQMHKYYYVIIWTASLPRYAKWALKKIDQQIHQYIDLLLTREYCIPHEKGFYQKILYMLGQELSTLLIIENDFRSIIDSEKDYLHLIDSFVGQDDNVLFELSNRLIEAYKYYQEGFSFQRAVKMTQMKQN